MNSFVVLSCGTRGDVLPFIELAAALRDRRNCVLVLTNRQYQEECRKAGLTAEFLDTVDEGESMSADIVELDNPRRICNFVDKHIIPRLFAALSIMERINQHRPLHLVTMAFFGLTSLLAEKLGSRLTTIFLAPDQLRRARPGMEFLWTTMPARLNDVCRSIGIDAIKTVDDFSRYPQRRVGLWPDWFERNPTQVEVDVHRTGFILPPRGTLQQLPSEMVDAMTDGIKLALITNTSGRSVYMKKFYSSAVSACQALGLKTILVSRYPENLPQGLTPDVVCTRWLSPIGVVMERVSVVIHHGGIGTVAAACLAGTPQLVLADGLDRPLNGAYVEDLGIGKSLDPTMWLHQATTETLASLLNSSNTKNRCHAISRRMQSTDSLEATCNLIEQPVIV